MNLKNEVRLTGNIGGDPEIKTFENGSKVANCSIAVDDSYTKKSDNGGEREKVTVVDWIDLSAWGYTADLFEKYVKKGTRLTVGGKLKTRSYEDKEGNNRIATYIKVESILFHGEKRAEEINEANTPEGSNDDDLPF